MESGVGEEKAEPTFTRNAVATLRCLTATPPEGCKRAGILPGRPSLDRGSREAEVGFELQNFRSVNSCSNHFGHLAWVELSINTSTFVTQERFGRNPCWTGDIKLLEVR
ncbi:hypothetical protein CSKR_111387 [Clonorchis sinensis]|uniref:Uncharacterized protein n=1 Tax=Clonorchis sinensis TaxID=79923 RepID=A0A419QAY6_CLOSI|nr:hypothetical protein CSKR_111387 [Clonorchis sinensis]